MASVAAPRVECELHHPTLSVSDLRAAVDFYTNALGFQPGFTWGDPPTMAGVNLGDVSIHLVQGTPSPQGSSCSVYFVVGDADELFEFQRAHGADIVTARSRSPPGD
jgi:catechol 2,3-dioxygenase-like lactoylglutathione lyase family enzyme